MDNKPKHNAPVFLISTRRPSLQWTPVGVFSTHGEALRIIEEWSRVFGWSINWTDDQGIIQAKIDPFQLDTLLTE